MPISAGEVISARKAMRAVGAIGPELAQPASALPEKVHSELGRFVDAGFIREGPAGTYYLHEARASAVLRAQVLKAIVFWVLVIIIPVIILQLSNSRPATP